MDNLKEKKNGEIPNELLNSRYISLKAKGLYAYLQTKPNDWDFSAREISYEMKEGISGVNKILQELEESNYLERVKKQNNKGHWVTEYLLYNDTGEKTHISAKAGINKGYVYLAEKEDTNSLKIGFSANPKARIKQLNNASDVKINLLYTIIGYRQTEKRLHKKFEKIRLNTEWFENSEDVISYFKKHNFNL